MTADRPPASGEPSSEALRNALEEVLDVWPAPSPEAFHRLHRLLTGHDSCEVAEARATPPALDVERLTKAYRLAMGWDAPAAWMDVVAAEYARLSQQKEQTDD